MSHTLTEADNWPNTITVPDGGDPRTAASVEVFAQGLADRARYARNRVRGLAASYTELIPMAPNSLGNDAGATYWRGNRLSDTGGRGFRTQSVTAPGGSADLAVIIPLPTPKADTFAKIISVKAYFHPGTGRGSLPANFPVFSVYRNPLTGSGSVLLSGGTVTDTAASVVLYEVPRSLLITVGGGGHVITATENYFVAFSGEYGGGAQAGAILLGVELVTVPV